MPVPSSLVLLGLWLLHPWPQRRPSGPQDQVPQLSKMWRAAGKADGTLPLCKGLTPPAASPGPMFGTWETASLNSRNHPERNRTIPTHLDRCSTRNRPQNQLSSILRRHLHLAQPHIPGPAISRGKHRRVHIVRLRAPLVRRKRPLLPSQIGQNLLRPRDVDIRRRQGRIWFASLCNHPRFRRYD